MSDKQDNKVEKASSPSSTGPAGSLVEGKVGAYYLLSMLGGHEPRGLEGTSINQVTFQRGDEGFPLDDVIVHASDFLGKPATLEIQVKRSITFAPTDEVFRKVVGQIVKAANKQEFDNSRYELAVAIAKTTTNIESSYHDLLTWAKQLDAETFTKRFKSGDKSNNEKEGAANGKMRTFITTFKGNLKAVGCPNDDYTVWKLLRRLQIIVFDFTAHGSVLEEQVKDRAALMLHPDDRSKATMLWNTLIKAALNVASNGGSRNRDDLIQDLIDQKLRLESQHSYASTLKLLGEATKHTLDDINDKIDNVKLTRAHWVEQVHSALNFGRYAEIRGQAGIGKSGILKHFAQQVAQESKIIILNPARTIPNGWSAMREQLGLKGTAHDLLSELAVSGAGYLFIDNLDFYSEEKQKTVLDLIREAADIPQFKVLTTVRESFGIDDPGWLPDDIIQKLGKADPIIIKELDDTEVDELRQSSAKLAPLLKHDHPAKKITRNLFKLSKLATLPSDDPVYTESDMASQWWNTADGKKEGKIARSRLLKFLSEQCILTSTPIDISGQSEAPIEALIATETLRLVENDKVLFYHDVLREWAIANLLHVEASQIEHLPLDRLATPDLRRALELAASIALRKKDYPAWQHLLNEVTTDSANQSWRHAVLISLLRSGITTEPLESHSSLLFADDGKILSELIRIVIAVEVTPARKAIGLDKLDSTEFPDELLNAWNVPNAQVFYQLMTWIHSKIHNQKLPVKVIPDVVSLYSTWSEGVLRQPGFLVNIATQQFYDWLKIIEDANDPDFERRTEPFNGAFSDRETKQLKGRLRLSFLTLSNHQPELAKKYLESIHSRRLKDEIVRSILDYHGSLPQAAPEQLANFIIDILIPKPDVERYHSSGRINEPFSRSFDLCFHPPFGKQKIFIDLLTHSKQQGMRVIGHLINHAVTFNKKEVDSETNDTDFFTVPFLKGQKRFGWKRTYFWVREYAGGSTSVKAGLIAIKSWASQRIESGVPIENVIEDIIEDEETPAAYLLIVVDLILGYWPQSREVAVPFLSCPELLCIDRSSIALSTGREARKKPYLCLDDLLKSYVGDETNSLREIILNNLLLEKQSLGEPSESANLFDPAFMTLHALNRLDQTNYEKPGDSNRIENWIYISPANEKHHFEKLTDALQDDNLQTFMQVVVPTAVERPDRLSGEQLNAAILWCQEKCPTPDNNDNWLSTVSTAMLLIRDGEESTKLDHQKWAKEVFIKTIECPVDPVHMHRAGLMFNPKAIAFAGLVYLYKLDSAVGVIESILKLACSTDPAAAHGFLSIATILSRIDEKLIKSILRCGLQASVKPDRDWNLSEEVYSEQVIQYEALNKEMVNAEIQWIAGNSAEPAWPDVPDSPPRRERSFPADLLNQTEQVEFSQKTRFDHQSAALWLGALNTLEHVTYKPWVFDILLKYQSWTKKANGIDPERGGDLMSWNTAYFKLLAQCSAHLDPEVVESEVLPVIIALPDEQFFENVAVFLNAIDVLCFEEKTISLSLAVELRSHLTIRYSTTHEWNRLRNSRDNRIGFESGPAIGVLFFNDFAMGKSRYYLKPEHNDLVTNFLPNLASAIQDCPSIILAIFSLDLLECDPDPAHFDFCLKAAEAWLGGYNDYDQFWVGYDIGRRLSLWLINVIKKQPDILFDPASKLAVEKLSSILLSFGVSDASALESLIIKSP